MFKKILVATDGSPLSIAAASAAIEFAAASGASLVGLSLAQFYPFLLMPEAGAMVDLSAYEEAQDQMAQQAVKKLEEQAKTAGVNCVVFTKRAVHPYEEIISTANESACDLIWMASHGRRGLDKLLLGSETQRVLAHSAIPVMVYRQPPV
jgi:nucleotide-binding universal stress UspA family protein